jgi:hypothetical protein
MTADHSHDFPAQEAQEVGLNAAPSFMLEQNLEAIARNRCRATPVLPVEPFEDAQAALRLKSLPNKFFASLGIVIGTFSPLRRRVASQ